MRMVFSLFVIVLFSTTASGQRPVKELRRYTITGVVHLQGAAVDGRYFYAISNARIDQYKKSDGKPVRVWDGSKEGIIRHLNSGVVIGGKLYCANSNFPDTPMTSSIEIFDTRTMKHIGSHSFGIFAGSATWIDQRDGFWWVVFANYNGKHAFQGRDNRWTTLVRFSKDWAPLASWVFPKEVLEAFAPNSNSGGNWSRNGHLFITGHDKKEMYIMKLPEMGSTLQLLETVPVINAGQAIAIDRSEKTREVFYAVSREDNAVLVEVIK